MNNEYEVYRTTTLGIALQETIDEMIQSNQLKKDIGVRIIKEYDKSISKVFSNKVKNRINFKSKLDTYRNCDNVWTLVFNGIDITLHDSTNQSLKVEPTDKVKIVACEGKSDKKGSKNFGINDE